MATTPVLIDFNGKQYDYNALKEAVYNNYDTYARRFGYSRSKYDKDRQGLIEILGQIESGNGTIQPDQIVFNGTWGEEKGSFGKARNRSRHYRNPTWMIIDTLRGMSPYDANAGKKKINQSTLNQELTTALSGISGLIHPGNKIRAQREAIAGLLNKYRADALPEGYIIEDGFDLNSYRTKLQDVLKALETTDREDDDEYAYYALGITNPNTPQEKPKEQNSGASAFIKAARDFGITEASLSDDALSTIYYNQQQPKLIDKFLESQGLSPISNNKSNSSSSTNEAGVKSGSTTTEKPVKTPVKQPTQPTQPSKNPSQLNLDKKLKVGDQIIVDGKRYMKNKNGEIIDITNNEALHKWNRLISAKNGAKLEHLRNIKKYQEGQKMLRDLGTVSNIAGVGASLFGSKGKLIGRLLFGAGALANVGSDLGDAYQNYKEGELSYAYPSLSRAVADGLAGYALTRIGKAPKEELEKLRAQESQLNQGLTNEEAEEFKQLDLWKRKGELHKPDKKANMTPEEKAEYDEKIKKYEKLKAIKENGRPEELKSIQERIAALEAKANPKSETFVSAFSKEYPYKFTGPTGKAILGAGAAQLLGNGIIPTVLGDKPSYSAERTIRGLIPVIGATGTNFISRFTPEFKFNPKVSWKRLITPAVASPLLMSQLAEANDNVTYMDNPIQIMPYAFSRNPGQTITGLNGVEHTVKGFKNNWEGFPVTVDTEGREYYPMLDELTVIGDKSKSKKPSKAVRDLERGIGTMIAPIDYVAGPLWAGASALGEIADTWTLHNENKKKEEQIKRIENLKKHYLR